MLKYFSFLLKLFPILYIIVLFLQVSKENATGRFEYDSEEEIFEVATDGVPLCGGGHRMNFNDFYGGDNEYYVWVCKLCVQHGLSFRWFCQSCPDDYCAECVNKFWPFFRFGSITYPEYLFEPENSIVSSKLSKLKGIFI